MTLQKVRHKQTGRVFMAYAAIDQWSQELTWYRPRWWGGETAYWKEDIEVLATLNKEP
jgi:hypothetical protein